MVRLTPTISPFLNAPQTARDVAVETERRYFHNDSGVTFTQLMDKVVRICSTQRATDNAGYEDSMSYQMAKRAIELRKDLDAAMCKNTVATTGAAAIPSKYNVFLCYVGEHVPGYKKKVTPSSEVPMELIVNHIDHICQLAGNANHCGIGTDLDGGFGREQSPGDLDTIGDVINMKVTFEKRGYSKDDIEKIFHRNFIEFFLRVWK
jgi:hypothetical protein